MKRGRELLRVRLIRRGLTLSAALLGVGLSQSASSAAVPVGLARTTVQAALLFAAGETTAAGAVSAQVAHLVKGGLNTMVLTKVKVTAVLLLGLGAALSGAGLLAHRVLAAKQADEAPAELARVVPPTAKDRAEKPQPTDAKEAVLDTFQVSGRVLDPDGNPAAGAKVYRAFRMVPDTTSLPVPALRTKSGADGRFTFAVAKSEVTKDLQDLLQVVAVADGFGPAWAEGVKADSAKDLTLRLAKDDVPVSGRVVNLEGRPIAGVTVRVSGLLATAEEDLTAWIRMVKEKKPFQFNDVFKRLGHRESAFPGLTSAATTSADGRFRLTGFGRERLALLYIVGPKVETEFVVVMTRAGPKFQAPDAPTSTTQFTVYGATFEHAAAPPKPITGTVRDKDTGQPLAGVTIDSGPFLRVSTDQEGKYRIDSVGPLAGLFPDGVFRLAAVPPEDQPYLVSIKEVQRGPRLKTSTVDFELKRGVLVHGRVTDKVTGGPVPAFVEYYALRGNRNVDDAPGFPPLSRFQLFGDLFQTRADGSFRIAALPGPGLIAVRASKGYITAATLTKEETRQGAVLGTFNLENYHGIAKINPAKDSGPVTCNLALDTGRTLTGTILGPDGKPLAGARLFNVQPLNWWNPKPLPTASFTISAVDPKKTRSLIFLHPEKKLVKTMELQGNEPGPLTVRLEPAGAVTGRLLDADGQPLAKVDLLVLFDRKDNDYGAAYFPERVATDGEGRFRVDGLAPGLVYQIDVAGKPPRTNIASVARRVAVKSGESKDLGDIKAKPYRE